MAESMSVRWLTASQRRIVSEISSRVASEGRDGTIVLYGSRAYGVHHEGSDADVMVIYPATIFQDRPKRTSAWSRGVATSLYELSWDDLASDALCGAYGGYFAFKLCAPTVSSDPRFSSEALAWPAALLKRASLLGDGWDETAPDERLARFYEGVVALYPTFLRCLARLYSRPALWSDLWVRQRRRLMQTRVLEHDSAPCRVSMDRLRRSFYECGEEMHPDDSFVALYDGKEWTADERRSEKPLRTFLERQKRSRR